MPSVETAVRALLEWFGGNARDLPWRHTRDPYAIWISEVMLQQTQVSTVVPYWSRWMQAIPNVRALAAARPEVVLKLWEGLGYYRRARHLHDAARAVVADFGGSFPRDFEAVLALPGIGEYTAGAICSLAYNQPVPVLDGNVIRVLTRLAGIRQRVDRAPVRRRLRRLAQSLVRTAAAGLAIPVPSGSAFWRRQRVQDRPCGTLNEALMELGATLCTPRQPRCDVCPVRAQCVARAKGFADQLPLLPPRPTTIERRVHVFVCRRGSHWLVRQRADHGINAGLWEFPSTEAVPGRKTAAAAARFLFGESRARVRPLFTLKHTITRHRITLEVHELQLVEDGLPFSTAGDWLELSQVEQRPFSAAHLRILRRLGGLATAEAPQFGDKATTVGATARERPNPESAQAVRRRRPH